MGEGFKNRLNDQSLPRPLRQMSMGQQQLIMVPGGNPQPPGSSYYAAAGSSTLTTGGSRGGDSHPVTEIRYPDFEQWLQTAGSISYVTSVMLARSKSESTLSEMSDMTNSRKRIFSIPKRSQRRSRLNYHDIGTKSEFRDGIRQHHVALLRWTNLVGRLSKQLSSAFGEFSKSLETIASELRVETEKTNQMFRNTNVKNPKPTFILGRTLDKIWLTVLDNVSDQARVFGELSKTLTLDFAPSFTELIEHHQKFIGQIYAFECGLEHLLTEYRKTTEKSFETAELAKTLALQPTNPHNMPKSGLGSLSFAVDAQNAYVLNLHNYNTMVSQYEQSLMPILVEEMEEASTDLMAYGVKFLDAVTQLVGKRYGELKGRMEVVEFACRYQTKVRQDISAYVRSYLDAKRHQQINQLASPNLPPPVDFSPIPVTPKNQLLSVEDNEHKLSETADAISEEIFDIADLRRTKQIELEKLEEKYHACLSNINMVASSNAEPVGTAATAGIVAVAKPSAVAKEALPSFSSVTFTLKENIADAKRMVALATAKLNSLKHQMDLLSATRRQPPPSSIEAEFRSPGIGVNPSAGSSSGNAGAARLSQAPISAKPPKGIRRSLTQWFSFLTVSNGHGPNENRGSFGNRHASNSAAFLGSGHQSGDEHDFDDHADHEYHPNFDDGGGRGGDGLSARRASSKVPDDEYYNVNYNYDHRDHPVGEDDEEEASDEDKPPKEKTKIFSVKGFKKTIERLRKYASEDHTSTTPKARRRNHHHRTQSHEPDPVYALLKCASKLNHVNLESHATNCDCEDCPARRLVTGVSSTILPAQLAFAMPSGSSGSQLHQSSSAVNLRQNKALQQQQQQQEHDRLMQSSMLIPEHPAAWARHRLSSTSVSGGATSTSRTSTSPGSGGMAGGGGQAPAAGNRNSMIVMSNSQTTSGISTSTTGGTTLQQQQQPFFYQHQTSLTNLRR